MIALRKAPLVAVALAGAFTLTACGSGDDTVGAVNTPAPAAAAGDAAAAPAVPFGLVTADVARQLAADPSITVLDVRTADEYNGGHLAGATMIDFYGSDFAARIGELDRSATYLVYCRSGNRSGQATALMAQMGFDRVYDLDGGAVAWASAGLPFEG